NSKNRSTALTRVEIVVCDNIRAPAACATHAASPSTWPPADPSGRHRHAAATTPTRAARHALQTPPLDLPNHAAPDAHIMHPMQSTRQDPPRQRVSSLA